MPNQYTGPLPLPQRFWSKVDMSGGLFACWPWMGAYNKSARFARGRPEQRPSFWVPGATMYAHRVALLLFEGRELWELQGMEACHLCEEWNRAEAFRCCNPAHLYWGTRAENDRDRYRR